MTFERVHLAMKVAYEGGRISYCLILQVNLKTTLLSSCCMILRILVPRFSVPVPFSPVVFIAPFSIAPSHSENKANKNALRDINGVNCTMNYAKSIKRKFG